MRQKLGESGSMLGEKRAAIERNTDNYRNMCNCFPSPVNFISPFFFSYHPAKSTRPRSLCPFISLSWPSSSDLLSVWLFLPSSVASPQTHSPSSQVSSTSFISICSLPSYFSLSPSPWGQSITAATGDASQLTLSHPSKLTLCNPHIFWQCVYCMTIRLFDLCPLDKHQTKL